MEDSHAKLAKNLLQGSSCNDCLYNKASYCSLFEPIKVKYPNDVQLFINGMIAFNGFVANQNRYIMTDDKIYVNQAFIELTVGDQIVIYSRGTDQDGNYECQVIATTHETKTFPSESICDNWIKKKGN